MGNIQPNYHKLQEKDLVFRNYEIRVVAPVDPLEGQRYVDPVHSKGKENYMDQLYNIMSSKEDYINPTANEKLSWRSVSSCTSHSGEALENWQNKLHDVSMYRCMRATRVVQRVGAEARALPTYEQLPNIAYLFE